MLIKKSIKYKNSLLYIAAGMLLLVSLLFPLTSPVSAAACGSPAADYGSAKSTITVPADGLYNFWSRIMVPDTVNNSYMLEVSAPSGVKCYIVGDSSIQPNTWTWVGKASNGVKIDLNLTKGTHNVRFIGNKPGVKFDRLIVTTNGACVPTGNGNNCDVPNDSKPPVVSLTAPKESSTISGTVQVAATATDDAGMSKVEFYANSTLIGSSAAAPYAVNWNSAGVTDGKYLLIARAYDVAGNVSTDSYAVFTKNGTATPPEPPKQVESQAPTHDKVVVSWQPSNNAANYKIVRNGVPYATVPGDVTTFEDTDVLPGTDYSYAITAYDAAGNKSGPSETSTVKTPSVDDIEAPTVPDGLTVHASEPTQANLTWEASTDNIAVAAYEVYRQTGSGSPQKFVEVSGTTLGDASLQPNTKYTYYVIAKDANGNKSAKSSSVSVTTPAPAKQDKGVITGRVFSGKTDKPTAYAHAEITVKGVRHIYATNKRGEYLIRELAPGSYNITFSKSVYHSQTVTVKSNNDTVTFDVTLKEK